MISKNLVWIPLVATLVFGCATKPEGAVSEDELVSVRQTHAQIALGATKEATLGAFKVGNKVKLSAALLGGVNVEEWKVEAFHDEKSGRDLFVTFLYFCDGLLADQSDNRIDFRDNAELVTRWRESTAK